MKTIKKIFAIILTIPALICGLVVLLWCWLMDVKLINYDYDK